ncbi:MAG: DUF927 domain-containing protein [Magnetococcales bacterium]|nr:DUF927 domain-containing protein [Magnetococcales bacterium]
MNIQPTHFKDAYARLGQAGQLAIYGRYGAGSIGKRPSINPLTNEKEDNPAFNLHDGKDGKVLWYVHNTHEKGDLYDFLCKTVGQDTAHRELGLNGYHIPIPTTKTNTSQPIKSTEEKQADAKKIWEESRTEPDHQPVLTYLKNRAISCDISSSIRYHPTMRLLVAKVEDVDGEFLGIHRIWLIDPKDGERRKKMSLGPISGGAVRLGNVVHDGKLALTEGIEDALSVQQATMIPTWAALSTSGLKGIKLPGWARKVWIFSDSDPNQAGQTAAMDAAKRLVKEGRQVWIVYPVDQGTEQAGKVDFNDLLRQDPTGESIRDRLRGAKEIQSEIPWSQEDIPNSFKITRKMVFFIKENKDSQDEFIPISGPVWVAAFTRDLHQGGWGCVVRWLDMDGKEHERAIPRARFHEQGPVLAQELSTEGLKVIPGKEGTLKTYLGLFEPVARWQSVPRLGWLDDPSGRLAFILPNQVLEGGSNPCEKVVFQPERHAPTASTIRESGTLADWQNHVAKYCSGNPVFVFSLCLAFAGTLLKAARMDSGGFHFYGRSSGGKTTAAQIAATVWGCGADPAEAPDMAYVRRWNTTANAAEGLASAHNDGLLVLDELGSCSAKDFGKLVYDITGGQGKAAMDASRNLKAQRTWRILILSTGEFSSKQKIEEGGQTANAGQLIRMLDISTTNIISNPHGDNPAMHAKRMKRNCSQYFGTAGPIFLKKLLQTYPDSQRLRDSISLYLEAITTRLTPKEAQQEQARAVRRFALVEVAGILAGRLGIIPLSEAEISKSIQAICQEWWTKMDTISDVSRGVESVHEFILMHQAARFGDANDSSNGGNTPRNQAGYVDRAANLYLFSKEGFREACGGYDYIEVARELANQGWLIRDGASFMCRHQVVGIPGRPRWYAVNATILEGRKDDENG